MKDILLFLSVIFILGVGSECLPHQDDTEVGVHSSADSADDDDDNLEEVEIASEAYVYFYPILMNLMTLFNNCVWPHGPSYFPMNTFSHLSQLLDWTIPNEHDGSAEFLYSRAWLDLEKHPVVVNIPAVAEPRYYSLTFTDLYTVNIKVVSPRTRGGSWTADQYIIVGPGFSGNLLSCFDEDHTIRSLTRFTFIFGRTLVYDSEDLPIAQAIQSSYTLASLGGSKPHQTSVPIFPFINGDEVPSLDIAPDVALPEAQVIFSNANFIMKYMMIEDFEIDLFKKFSKIEIGPSIEFIGQEMSQQMYGDIENGIAGGVKQIDDAVLPEDTVNGWADYYSSKAVHDDDYLGRAVIIMRGQFVSVPREAIYRTGFVDSDGDLLDGTKYDYTLTFSPGNFPPVVEAYGGFWSVTVYLGSGLPDKGILVHNPIGRYVINGMITPGLVYNANGALTLYIQKMRPDTDVKTANWLPTPDPEFDSFETGGFHLILRVYVPEDLDYYPPSIVKAGPAT